MLKTAARCRVWANFLINLRRRHRGRCGGCREKRLRMNHKSPFNRRHLPSGFSETSYKAQRLVWNSSDKFTPIQLAQWTLWSDLIQHRSCCLVKNETEVLQRAVSWEPRVLSAKSLMRGQYVSAKSVNSFSHSSIFAAILAPFARFLRLLTPLESITGSCTSIDTVEVRSSSLLVPIIYRERYLNHILSASADRVKLGE
jgi:hypothetical protein